MRQEGGKRGDWEEGQQEITGSKTRSGKKCQVLWTDCEINMFQHKGLDWIYHNMVEVSLNYGQTTQMVL